MKGFLPARIKKSALTLLQHEQNSPLLLQDNAEQGPQYRRAGAVIANTVVLK